MKQPVWFLASSVGLTVILYVLAYYLLPPPPPSASMVLLFAAIAMVAVWMVSLCVRKLRARGHKPALLWFVIAGVTLAMALSGCSSARPPATQANAGSGDAAAPAPPPPHCGRIGGAESVSCI